MQRNYYGSEHGKGEGDGEIGVINRAVDRATCIFGRQSIIRNAFQFLNGARVTCKLTLNFQNVG